MSLDSMTGVFGQDASYATGSQHDYTYDMDSKSGLTPFLHHVQHAYSGHQQASSLGSSQHFNASAILASRQQHQIQVIAATFSSVTIFSTVCAIYWFCMMRRNFRRDLILLLIIGDVWKSLWFLTFSATTLSRGHISTQSAFCQTSGYLLQTGIESCDVAILLISLHMSLQIFPPRNTFLGHDGLYQARKWVWAAWFVLPNLSASLAFINQNAGYISQGGFCSLPIRPFWYRLALSWIPRYLIWLYVMGVALRIYFHVGFEFKVFANEKDQSSTTGRGLPTVPTSMGRTASSQSDSAGIEKQIPDDATLAPEDDIQIPSGEVQAPEPARLSFFRPGRRQSVPNWTSPFGDFAGSELDEDLRASRSVPSSRRGSKQLAPGKPGENTNVPASLDLAMPKIAFAPPRPVTAQPSYDPLSSALEPITEYKTYQTSASAPENAGQRAMQDRRRAIQRQLRVLFIYPIVYLIFWIMPFVAHCFNYSNYYAQHPIFAISALNVFCQTFMGFADVCIFSWRERPWRHIPGSDGTFLGSFLFWRFSSSRPFDHPRSHNLTVSSANATAGDHTQASTVHSTAAESSRANSHASFLTNIKHWSLSAVPGMGTHSHHGSTSSPVIGGPGDPLSPSQRGSDASTFPTPSSPRRPPAPGSAPSTHNPLAHRRAFSGGHSDRRVREAELAHERLALERADWALHQQQLLQRNRQRERTSATTGPGDGNGGAGGGGGGGGVGRSASAISSSYATTATGEKKDGSGAHGVPERKEWWDRQMSLEGDYES